MSDVATLDQELDKMILNGQALEAFEKYYAEDVVMQENSNDHVAGKDANRKREEDFFASLESFHGAGVVGKAVTGDRSYGEWWMDVTFKGAGRVKMEQVVSRVWKDGLVSSERFYYNAG
jgi:ketosteroid isomerase-like protein